MLVEDERPVQLAEDTALRPTRISLKKIIQALNSDARQEKERQWS